MYKAYLATFRIRRSAVKLRCCLSSFAVDIGAFGDFKRVVFIRSIERRLIFIIGPNFRIVCDKQSAILIVISIGSNLVSSHAGDINM